MSYAAGEVVSGTATVVDTEERVELAWVMHDRIPRFVPYGLFEPVQVCLGAELSS